MGIRYIVLLLFLGCILPGWAAGQDGAALEGTEWHLLQLGKRSIPRQPDRRRDPYLVFDGNRQRVAGYAGCNHVQGSYEREGDRLAIGELTSTRMRCSTGYELETYFLRTLGRVQGWRMADGELELLDGEGEPIARFEAVER